MPYTIRSGDERCSGALLRRCLRGCWSLGPLFAVCAGEAVALPHCTLRTFTELYGTKSVAGLSPLLRIAILLSGSDPKDDALGDSLSLASHPRCRSNMLLSGFRSR